VAPETIICGTATVLRPCDHGETAVTPVTLRAMPTGDPSTSREPQFAFAGGGTGGHIYPALAIANALAERIPNARFLFFCTQRPVDERILGQASFDVVRQPLRHLSKKPWRWPSVLSGWRSARRLCRQRFRARAPDFVLGTGGLASVPAIVEANRAGIPTAILNPDVKPGKANRFLSRRVNVVFSQWEATRAFLSSRELVVTGCPVRPAFENATRNAGIDVFGLDLAKKTLLVTGASQGAKSINAALGAIAEKIATYNSWQVLHLAGEGDEQRVTSTYRAAGVAATTLAYTDKMPEAMAAADLVISRAGASALAEITAMGRPSILLPYPYHKDQHQLENARCLARASAAQILHDRISSDLNGPALWKLLEPLLRNDAERAAMASAAKQLGRLDAAEVIADRIFQRT